MEFCCCHSIPHPFLGDYVRLRQNVQWKKLCISLNDQYIVFADVVSKITRSTGKVRSNFALKLCTVTTNHLNTK